MSKHKHTSRKKKIIRNVVCTVFSFLMMVCLMILFAFFALDISRKERDLDSQGRQPLLCYCNILSLVSTKKTK